MNLTQTKELRDEAKLRVQNVLEAQSATKDFDPSELSKAVAELKALDDAYNALSASQDNTKSMGVPMPNDTPIETFAFNATETSLRPNEVANSLKCLSMETLNAIHSNSYKSSFMKYVHGGLKNLGSTDLKAITEGNDGEGGYLVPYILQPSVIERKPMNTPFLDRIPNVQAAGPQIKYPKVQYTGATDDPVPNEFINPYRPNVAGNVFTPATSSILVAQTAWELMTITAYTWGMLEIFDRNILADSEVALEPWIAKVFNQMTRVTKEKLALNGTGVNQPVGVLTALNGTGGTPVPKTFNLPAMPASPTSAQVEAYYAALMAIPDTLDEQYHVEDSFWLMNTINTKATLNTMLTSNGQLALSEGYQNSLLGSRRSTTLGGYDTAYSNAMPNAFTTAGNVTTTGTVSGATPYLFMDPNACVGIERLALSVRRLDELFATSNQVGLIGSFRWGFGILEEWAIVVGKNG